jgi:uncharacterized membrane protein
MNTKLFNRIIFVLSLIGVAMAIYVLQSWMRKTSIVCLTGGCDIVRKNSASYPFGIPVPLFGLIGYVFLAVFAFLRTLNSDLYTKLLKPMVGIALFGICFVSWFTYTELFIIKGICMWCAISTVNMYVVFGLVVFSFKSPKSLKEPR